MLYSRTVGSWPLGVISVQITVRHYSREEAVYTLTVGAPYILCI